MTDDLRDLSVDSDEQFRAALAAVVESAVENDLDVRGAWAFETGGSTHNWELEVVEMADDLDLE
jgi:hypothetical protein